MKFHGEKKATMKFHGEKEAILIDEDTFLPVASINTITFDLKALIN